MATAAPAFSTRLLYAPSAELIDYAEKLGFNSVVAATIGHKHGHPHEDVPVLLPDYPKLRTFRPDLEAEVEAHTAELRARFKRAKAAGLEVMLHTYEPSVHYGFLEAYPDLFSPEIHEYRAAAGDLVAANRNLCVARPEVRELLSAKIAELCRRFPEIDSISYTNNESSSTTKVWHRCDHCRDIPYPHTMQYLHDALQEGIRRAGNTVELHYRCWGSHDHDMHYHGHLAKQLELGLQTLPDKAWLEDYVRCFAPAHLHFVPSRDNPRFAEYLRTQPTQVIYKATWADTNLHHPLNPWLGTYKPADETCEISFEFCRDCPDVFYVMAREMQRRARLCREKGVTGLAAVPLCWGMQPDRLPHCSTPSKWMLGEANLVLFARLMHDPDVDLVATATDYLRDRYGQELPDAFAHLLLDSEAIAAGMMNIRGVRATGSDLASFTNSLTRYGPMREDWEQLLRFDEDAIAEITAAKAQVVARAEQMLQTIDAHRGALPEQAYTEFKTCFGNLLQQARAYHQRHHLLMTAYGILDGALPPTARHLQTLCQLQA